MMLWFFCVLAYLLIGVRAVRDNSTGGTITMIGYNYPLLGLSMLLFVIFFWPLFYLAVIAALLYYKK